ncbi:hypothetical protein [Nonomuraea sp. NPDC050310]|uniref:hypothetical protein n=1 Tax=Nonomuraea sp. NPDC050310 TaxID=3154935 RepID=UPI0034083037
MSDDQVTAAVHRVIDRYDPEGLLAMGAPQDEYRPEVEDLAALVRGAEPITPERVAAVWSRWFNGMADWSTRRPEQVAEVAATLEGLRRTR